MADQILQGGAAAGEVIDETRPGEASSMVLVGVRDALQNLGWYVVASHHTGNQSGGPGPGEWLLPQSAPPFQVRLDRP
ncbi:hypothetical protein DDE05_12430 [Streptomyces cavourensis]|nr:hypothetical protein DDE05_12430 [Streptomyces cavourensis]